MTKSRRRYIIYPVIVFLVLFFRQCLDYVLMLKGYTKAADLLLGVSDSGFGFDIILGMMLFITDYYLTKKNRETENIWKQLLRVFLVCAVLFMGAYFYPYDNILNDLLEEKILYPVFSLLKGCGFFDGVQNSDMGIWEGTFYLHFIMQEEWFFEWMVIYGVFQGCTLLYNLIVNKLQISLNNCNVGSAIKK